MKVLGQGFENALEPKNDDDDILKVVQHSFSYLRSNLLTDDVIKKRL